MTRVAWIVYGSLDRRTGGTIYDARIVSGLSRRGVDVRVHALRPGAPAAALVRSLASERADVVVGDELCFPELAFAFPRAPRATRILLVHHLTCWEHEPKPYARARARLLESRALRHADRVVATSDATRARLEREGVRRQVDVVRPGADRLPIAASAASEATTFLFVGAIAPRKRVLELVRGHALVRSRVRLRLVGDRVGDPRYVEAVVRAAAAEVALLGEIDELALAREIAASDAVVLPSSLEGYGIAATEAVRAGKPVIAARTEGLVEALSSCPDAVMFLDDGAPETIAAAMTRFIDEPGLRQRLAAAADRARLPTWGEAEAAFASIIEDGARPRA